MEFNRTFWIVAFSILAVAVVSASIAFFFVDFSSEPEKEVVSCGNLELALQGNCCYEQNLGNTAVSNCTGSWSWNSLESQCEYTCQVSNPAEDTTRFCTQDVQECSDGSYVSRDPYANCEFKACPDERAGY